MSSFCEICGIPLSAGVTNCPACNQPVQNGRYPGAPRGVSTGQGFSPPGATSFSPPSGGTPFSPPTVIPVTPAQAGAIQQRFETLRGLIRQYPVHRQRGLLSFLYRMHCPFCDYEFHPSDCAIYWLDNQRKYVLLEEAPKTNLERSFARLRIKALDVGEYYQRKAQRACPRCSSFFPSGFESYPTFTIAVIGDAFSGKSHFITALLHLLNERTMGEQGNIAVDFESLTDQTKAIFEKNDDTLFKEKKPLGATRIQDGYTYVTPPQRNSGQPQETFIQWQPLIFRLTIGYKEPGKDFHNNLLNLIFYDISGELIVNDTTQQVTWPISRAQGIIHVVDPLSTPGILPHLHPGPEVEFAKSILSKRLKSDQILRRVIFALVAKAGGNQRKPVSTPIAIMLSKSDLLEEVARRRNFPASFLNNRIYTGNVDIDEIDRISKEIEQFLRVLGETQLLNESQKFPHVKFFTASATGHRLDQDNAFPKVEPRRCLDPFLWLLLELTGEK